MFWFFIKGTFRNIAANKTFTSINILGLAIGITCALLISLFVFHETSYDNFHTNSNEIYRVTLHGKVNGITIDGATTTGAMAAVLINDFPDIADATRLARFGAWLISNDSIRYNEDNLLFADQNFFRFFDGFKLLAGNPDSVLSKPFSLVLTEDAAIKYFGSTNIVGKTLLLEAGQKVTVTGLMANPPSNTHIPFEMLGSAISYTNMFNYWTNNNCYTYIRVNGQADINKLTGSVQQLVEKYVFPEFFDVMKGAFTSNDYYRYGLQKMRGIHLHSNLEGELQPNAKDEYVYAFGITAILILIIACLNFMNLSSANSINRSKEVILRKVAGANKRTLIFQFLTESFFYSILALAIALIITEMALPVFNSFLGLKLQLHFFSNLTALAFIAILALIVGFFSGLYPAVHISSFEPAKVLQGRMGQGLRNSMLRSVFVVFQFFISILIIILTLIIFRQVNFMLKKDLGFDSENVIVVRRSDALKKHIEQFKSEILQDESVTSVTYSNSIPGRDFNTTTFNLGDSSSKTALLLNQVFVNTDYSKTYNLDITSGRFFDKDFPTDSFACVINESAARLIGVDDPLGMNLSQPSLFKKHTRQYTIIGVVEDFHFQSVEKAVQPLILCLMPGNWEGYINIKLDGEKTYSGISYIESVWKKYAPDYPFVYFYLKEDFQKNYDSIVRTGRVFMVFSVLAVFLALLGLFGLIAYTLNQRVHEVGIRKALGASYSRLVYELSVETFKLVGAASIIAWITAWFIAEKWLDAFPYRYYPGIWVFAIPAIIVLLIALTIITSRAIRIIRQEVGAILKYE